MPNRPKTKEGEDRAGNKYPHILRTVQQTVSISHPNTGTSREERHKDHIPPPLDPPDNIPTQPQRIRRIQQSPLRALQHIPLIHKVIQYLPALRDEVVQLRVCILREAVLTKGEVFSGL